MCLCVRVSCAACLGVPELPRVLPGAPQAGHGGEQCPAEARPGAGRHAGRAELVLG